MAAIFSGNAHERSVSTDLNHLLSDASGIGTTNGNDQHGFRVRDFKSRVFKGIEDNPDIFQGGQQGMNGCKCLTAVQIVCKHSECSAHPFRA